MYVRRNASSAADGPDGVHDVRVEPAAHDRRVGVLVRDRWADVLVRRPVFHVHVVGQVGVVGHVEDEGCSCDWDGYLD